MAKSLNANLQKVTQDRSMADAYASLQRIEQQQQTEAFRRGRKPKLSVHIQQMRFQHRMNAYHAKGQVHTLSTTSNHKIDASKVPLQSLKRISLQDLRLEEAKKGGYLTLRVLEPAFKIVGITTIVEDHEGNAVLFSVYNLTEDVNPNLDHVLPIGTVFILKEPYIKISAANECMIRCDCPSDMIIVFKGHALFPLVQGIKWKNDIHLDVVDPMFSNPVPKTALEWKERGNTLFKAKQYEYATRCYLLSLQELSRLANVGDLEQVLLMNASAAYLQQGYFEKSLEFAKKILKVFPGNKKVLDRAGRCCYKLRKYEEAKQYFDECTNLHPDDEAIKKELKKTNDRLLEQADGKFNMHNMLLTQSVKPRQKIDCADYTGPVEVIEIPGKGRGIVATKDIEPGTLLVVSKAIVFDWAPEDMVQIQVNHDNNAEIGSSSIIIANLAQLIAKNPNTFGPIVYDLYDGNFPVTNGSAGLFCNPETKEEPIVDVERIKGILATNNFSGNFTNPQAYNCLKVGEMIQGKNSGGLFALPSYFNHSCIPNAIWHIINDVMFIRATQYIKANEEVVLQYVSWEMSFSERQSKFQKRGFWCDCKLCIQDSRVPKSILAKREDIRLRFEKSLKQINGDERISPNVISHTQRLLNELVETYNTSEVPLNPSFLSMYTLLARAYSFDAGNSNWKYDKEIECNHNILKMFSFDPNAMLESIENGEPLISSNAFLTSQALRAIAKLVFIHNCARNFDVRNKWIKILLTLENVYSGGDINVVKLNYGFIKNLL